MNVLLYVLHVLKRAVCFCWVSSTLLVSCGWGSSTFVLRVRTNSVRKYWWISNLAVNLRLFASRLQRQVVMWRMTKNTKNTSKWSLIQGDRLEMLLHKHYSAFFEKRNNMSKNTHFFWSTTFLIAVHCEILLFVTDERILLIIIKMIMHHFKKCPWRDLSR